MLIFLLLQIALPVEGIEIELLPPLRGFIQHPLQEGGMRLADADKMISLHGSKGERILGVPRLEHVRSSPDLRIRLLQTWLPAARMEISVADFNNLAFHLGFVDVVWETSCNAMNGACLIADLTHTFLRVYVEVPLYPFERPVPELWPGDDEWVMRWAGRSPNVTNPNGK